MTGIERASGSAGYVSAPRLRAFLLVILLTALCPQAQLVAQQDTSRVAVTGVVGDASTGAPLEAALVAVPRLGIRTLTDENGRFVLLNIPPGHHEWLFRMLGYADWREEMAVEHMERLRVGLLPQPIALRNITVTVERLAQRRREVGVSVQTLSREDILSAVGTSITDVIASRSPAAVTSCPTGQRSAAPPPQNQHPSRVVPEVRRTPLGGADASVGICIRWRGRIISPTIVLDDELIPTSFDVLYSYAPSEIHSVEFYRGGSHIRVYTHHFIASGRPLMPAGLLFR